MSEDAKAVVQANEHSDAYAKELGRIEAILQGVEAKVLHSYWELGQFVSKFEDGCSRQAYGSRTIINLVQDLNARGRKISKQSLYTARRVFQDVQKQDIPALVSRGMTVTHLKSLLYLDDDVRQLVEAEMYDASGHVVSSTKLEQLVSDAKQKVMTDTTAKAVEHIVRDGIPEPLPEEEPETASTIIPMTSTSLANINTEEARKKIIAGMPEVEKILKLFVERLTADGCDRVIRKLEQHQVYGQMFLDLYAWCENEPLTMARQFRQSPLDIAGKIQELKDAQKPKKASSEVADAASKTHQREYPCAPAKPFKALDAALTKVLGVLPEAVDMRDHVYRIGFDSKKQHENAQEAVDRVVAALQTWQKASEALLNDMVKLQLHLTSLKGML